MCHKNDIDSHEITLEISNFKKTIPLWIHVPYINIKTTKIDQENLIAEKFLKKMLATTD